MLALLLDVAVFFIIVGAVVGVVDYLLKKKAGK